MAKVRKESFSEKNDCKRIEENAKSSKQKYIQKIRHQARQKGE